MDDMQEYELHDIYNAMDYADLSSIQQTRWIVYAIAQVNSRKKIKPEDILLLPTDDAYIKKNQVKNIEISNEDIDRLRAMSKEYSKILNKQHA